MFLNNLSIITKAIYKYFSLIAKDSINHEILDCKRLLGLWELAGGY